MSAPNTPLWGSNWQDWWKPPWLTLPGSEGMAHDPTAAFGSLYSMWSGSHPAITMPAGSIGLLMKEAATAWTELMSQAASHQAVVLSGWQEAFAVFAKDFDWRMPTAEGAGETDPVESLDQLLSRWTLTAEPILQQHAKSETYITSQSSLMRAAMKWQKAQAAVTESMCKQLGVPTRGEVDEAFRMIHELRRARRRDEYAHRHVDASASRTRNHASKAGARRGES